MESLFGKGPLDTLFRGPMDAPGPAALAQVKKQYAALGLSPPEDLEKLSLQELGVRSVELTNELLSKLQDTNGFLAQFLNAR